MNAQPRCNVSSELWITRDRRRYFLVPTEQAFEAGDTAIMDLHGTERMVSLASLAPYEITEEQARRWVKDQLGQTLARLGED